jgi:hypothetical protein
MIPTPPSDLLTETQRALANTIAERDEWAQKYQKLLIVTDEMREEENASYELIARQGDLLRGVVNALRGEPPPDTLWSHHDAPDLARAIVAERNRIQQSHDYWDQKHAELESQRDHALNLLRAIRLDGNYRLSIDALLDVYGDPPQDCGGAGNLERDA